MSYFFRETAQPFLSLQEEEGARKRVKTFAASEAEKSRLLPVSKGIGTCRWPDSREAAPAGLAAGGGGQVRPGLRLRRFPDAVREVIGAGRDFHFYITIFKHT